MNEIIHINIDDLEKEIAESKTIMLIDFGATWCGPCKQQLPILKKFAEDNPDIKVIKVDTDDSPSIASKFGIKGSPTLLLFKDGQKIETKLGLTSLASLNKMLEKITT